MAKHSIEITAFSSTSGLHEFLVMPLGLSNAPSHFMTQVDSMLTEYDLRSSAEAFVDDITTHGKTVEVYAAKQSKVLAAIDAKKLCINGLKVYAGYTSLRIFGHIVSKGEIRTDPDKVAAIRQL